MVAGGGWKSEEEDSNTIHIMIEEPGVRETVQLERNLLTMGLRPLQLGVAWLFAGNSGKEGYEVSPGMKLEPTAALKLPEER